MCWDAAITMRMTLNEPGRHKNKPLRLRVLWYYGFLPQSKYIVGVITGDCKLTVGVNGCLYLCVSLPQTGNLSRLDADSHPDSWDRLQPLHLNTWIIRFNHCAPYKINKKYNFISKLGSRRLELHSKYVKDHVNDNVKECGWITGSLHFCYRPLYSLIE